MKVSVIVPAYNEEKLIGECLRSIQQALVAFPPGWDNEIIVCDNNSTDRTAELARQAGAKVVFEPINQIGRSRNTGAKAASGDWLIFVDADSQPSRELFAEVAEAIQSGRCLAGGCTVRFEGNYPLAALGVKGWNWLSRTTRYLAGAFIFCEAATFRELGGFNEQLYASEEIDLSRRLKKAARRSGKRIRILHRHPLLTSARKVWLYSLREHFGVLGRTILKFGKPLKDPRECFTWYDGRR